MKSISKTKASQLALSDDSESQENALSPRYNSSYPGHRTKKFIFYTPFGWTPSYLSSDSGNNADGVKLKFEPRWISCQAKKLVMW